MSITYLFLPSAEPVQLLGTGGSLNLKVVEVRLWLALDDLGLIEWLPDAERTVRKMAQVVHNDLLLAPSGDNIF